MVELMERFGVTVKQSKLGNRTMEGRRIPNNKTLYDTLVAKLHEILQGDGVLYDLDRYGDKMLSDAGYKRIAACQCALEDLPANIPPHITLSAGKAYIFHITGHALAMLMRQDLVGAMGADEPSVLASPSDYFAPLNETSKNYNQDVWDKKVSAIWSE